MILLVAPASQEIVVLASLLPIKFLLNLALAIELLVQLISQRFIVLKLFLLPFLAVHFINARVAFVTLDVWDGSIELNQLSQVLFSLLVLV